MVSLFLFYSVTVIKPKDWGKEFKKCKGKAQSPINIDTKKLKKDSKLGSLKVIFKSGKVDKLFEGNETNNGHAPVFFLDKKSGINSISHSHVVIPSFPSRTSLIVITYLVRGCYSINIGPWQLSLSFPAGNATIKFDKQEYILEKFLYHFGCEDNRGSEHTVDGKAFPAEVNMSTKGPKIRADKI